MKLQLLTILPAVACVSCTAMNPTSTTNANVEQIERDGSDIQPNLNHGQHEAGRNAADFQHGNRGYHYRDGRYYGPKEPRSYHY